MGPHLYEVIVDYREGLTWEKYRVVLHVEDGLIDTISSEKIE